MRLIIAFLAAMGLMAGQAEARWERYWNGSCYAYRQVAEVATTTTVVNNLIGIPVPVQYTEPIAAQGTTVYGQAQGLSSLYSSYNSNVDMGLLYNQAARLTDQAQQLAGHAATDFASLVQAEGVNRTEVAKILAQGEAAKVALMASKGDQLQLTNRQPFAFRVSQDSRGEIRVERDEFNLTTPQPLTNTTGVSDLLRTRCVSCHNNEVRNGNLNLLSEISAEQQRAILDRVTTDDLTRRMPARQGGGAGQKLATEELNALFGAMGTVIQSR